MILILIFLPDFQLFDEYDPDTNILTRLSASHMKFERRKELKKMLNEELKSIGWHANRWWD